MSVGRNNILSQTLRLKHKLFLVITLICAIVASGMFFFMQWSFDRGFLNYVNKSDNLLFENLHTQLSESYQLQANWQFIKDKRRLWRELILDAIPDGYRLNQDRSPARAPRGRSTRRSRMDKRATGLNADPVERPNQLLHRLNLFDSEKVLLAGPPRDFNTKTTKAIKYQGAVVGYLALEARKILSETHELQFSEQQTDTFAFIALGWDLFYWLACWQFRWQIMLSNQLQS